MATVVSHQRVHGLKSESGPLSDMVVPNTVDDARKDVLLREGYSNSSESWCYWVPFPGVRYYCYGGEATNVGPMEHSPRDMPRQGAPARCSRTGFQNKNQFGLKG